MCWWLVCHCNLLLTEADPPLNLAFSAWWNCRAGLLRLLKAWFIGNGSEDGLCWRGRWVYTEAPKTAWWGDVWSGLNHINVNGCCCRCVIYRCCCDLWNWMASGRCGGVGGCALLLDWVGALVETVVVSMVLVPEAVPCEKIKKTKWDFYFGSHSM